MLEPSEPTLSPEQNVRKHLPRFPRPHSPPLGYLWQVEECPLNVCLLRTSEKEEAGSLWV